MAAHECIMRLLRITLRGADALKVVVTVVVKVAFGAAKACPGRTGVGPSPHTLLKESAHDTPLPAAVVESDGRLFPKRSAPRQTGPATRPFAP